MIVVKKWRLGKAFIRKGGGKRAHVSAWFATEDYVPRFLDTVERKEVKSAVLPAGGSPPS